MPRKTKKQPDYFLTLAAIVRDEGYYIIDWIKYHHFIGFEQFIVVLHKCTDDIEQKLNFLKENLKIDIKIHHCLTDNQVQMGTYKWIIDNYRNTTEWLLFLDADEYVNCIDPSTTIKELLRRFSKKVSGVAFNAKVFGPNGNIVRPSNRLIAYKERLPQCSVDSHSIKTFLRADKITDILSPHIQYVNGQVVRFDNKPFTVIDGWRSQESPIWDTVVYNHYHTGSLEDYVNRHRRGSCNDRRDNKAYSLNYLIQYTQNMEYDDTILRSNEIRKIFNIPINDASIKNTIFLSVADYLNPDESTKWFKFSAKNNNIPIRWVSYGDKWYGFVQNKIEKVLRYLQGEKAKGKKYVFILDSADVLFVKPVENILDRFNNVYEGGVLFNCDYNNVMWPLQDEMLLWHINSNYGCNGIVNAGCCCGLIDDVIALYIQILDIRNQILKKKYISYSAQLFSISKSNGMENKIYDSTGKLIDDDQWLIHILQAEYNPLIKLDKYKEIFALTCAISGQDRNIHDRDYVGNAVILHYPHIPIIRIRGTTCQS